MGLVESAGFVDIVLFWAEFEVWSGGLSGEWRGGRRESPLVRIASDVPKEILLIDYREESVLGFAILFQHLLFWNHCWRK